MRLQLAKWGNSLAIRLPVECIRAAGLKEGDELEAKVTPIGEIRLMPSRAFDQTAFLERLNKLHAEIPLQTEGASEFIRRLRDGDSLHLAMALDIGVSSLATADAVLDANARRHGLTTVGF